MLPPRLHRRHGRPHLGQRPILAALHALQWLSDNALQYTATASVLNAHELGLVPITTPAYSPQSNGLAEAFVRTFKRDYVDGAELAVPHPTRAGSLSALVTC